MYVSGVSTNRSRSRGQRIDAVICLQSLILIPLKRHGWRLSGITPVLLVQLTPQFAELAHPKAGLRSGSKPNFGPALSVHTIYCIRII